MANVIYPKYKEALLGGLSNIDLDGGTVKAALIDLNTYTYNAAHDFLNDVSGIVGTAQAIANTTVTNGLFDGDDVVFPSVAGASAEAILIYIDTGNSATSRLVALLDTGMTGLPVTPNSGNINLNWHASGIFQL